MSAPSRVLWALDTSIAPDSFERLSTALMFRSGFQKIRPVGGTHDDGCDAEEVLREGKDEEGRRTFFQYSLEKRWETKLRRELAKVRKHRHALEVFVFVTTSPVTARKHSVLQKEVQERYGWILHIFSREFLRHNLEEVHPDLADQYLGIPDTSGTRWRRHSIVLPFPDGAELREVKALFDARRFHAAIPKLMDAMAVSNRPDSIWLLVASAHYELTNYRDALLAVEKSLATNKRIHEALFLKACVLTEHGVASMSRPMIVQGRRIFEQLMNEKGRRADPVLAYNLANAMSALGEYRMAIPYYLRCLRQDAANAQAWKNLGSCYSQLRNHAEELRCVDRALALKPNLPEALFSKGQTLGVVYQRYAEGLTLIERAMEVDPDLPRRFPRAHWWQTKFLIELKRYDRAIEAAERGLEFAAGDQHLLDLKGNALAAGWRQDRKHLDAARDFFLFRLEVDEKEFASLQELISIERAAGSEGLAQAHLARTLNGLGVLEERQSAESITISWNEWDRLEKSLPLYLRFRRLRPIEPSHFGENAPAQLRDDLWLRLGAVFGDIHAYLRGLCGSPTIRMLVTALQLSRDGISKAFGASAAAVAIRHKNDSKRRRVRLLAELVGSLHRFSLFESSWNAGYLFAHTGVEPKRVTRAMDVLIAEAHPAEWAGSLIEPVLVAANAHLQLLPTESHNTPSTGELLHDDRDALAVKRKRPATRGPSIEKRKSPRQRPK